MDPAELKYLIDRNREIHKALMNPKRRSAPEEDVYKFARASIVADRDLPAGKIIESNDIWARRPGTGQIPGFEYNKVVGKRIKKDTKRNKQLSWNDFY